MVAKYSPSLANLFMALWEEDVVYAQRRPQVVLWARYIDNVLLLWDGDRGDLDAFMEELNRNNRGIFLNYEASQEEINFLDLKVGIKDDCFLKGQTGILIYQSGVAIMRPA